MRTSLLAGISAMLLLASCAKEEDVPQPTGSGTPACGLNGLRLEATFDGSAFCANASLFAAEGAGVITINGIDQQGRTLTLELDSLTVGSHAINAATNVLLFTTQLGLPYASSDATPGTLTITAHDTAARRLTGSFAAQLGSDGLPGPPKSIQGEFDVTYVE